MMSFLVAGFIAAAISSNQQTQDVAAWGNNEVAGYLREFGPDKRVAEDPFISPTPPIPPERIVLTFPVSGPQAADWASVYWTYDRDGQTMTVVASEDQNAAAGVTMANMSPQGTSLRMRGWGLTAWRDQPTQEFNGRRNVTVRLRHVTGFGEVSLVSVPTRRGEARVFRHTWAIAPEDARLLSDNLELRVVGKAQPWRGDERTLCVHDNTDMNQGVMVRSCFLTGLLETYQLVDKRDGSVIHEWNAGAKA